MLALALARLSGVPAATDVLKKIRATPAQAGLNRTQRARNVAGAFRVPLKRRPTVAGRRLVLIDDVMTTGATARACVRPLRQAGAARVDVLTLARVVPSG